MQIKKITDKNTWNKALERFKYSTMFLSWEWAEFERSVGSKFESWGVFDEDTVVGLIPIKVISAKRGKYLHVRHGPLIDWSNETLVEEVVSFLKDKAVEKDSHFIRISPLISKTKENEDTLKSFGFVPSNTHATDAELTVVLDLTKDEEVILSEMRKTTRNLIRKAQKLGIVVEHVSDLSLFEDFSKVYLDTVERQKWTAYSVDYIKKEYLIFSKEKGAEMFLAYFEGKPISASIFIKHRDQVIYHYSGSVTEFRNIPSAYLLHWEAIKYFKSLGFLIYNFWGVSPENKKNHPWYGLSLFKRGFTNQEMEFIHAHDLIVNQFAYLTRIYEYLESKLRGYR
jgi:peptidoglycan pentaglycine glycine transferase (the first glycine)